MALKRAAGDVDELVRRLHHNAVDDLPRMKASTRSAARRLEGRSPCWSKPGSTACSVSHCRHSWSAAVRGGVAWRYGGAVRVQRVVGNERRVPLKMLPFDNKNEFQVVVDLPEGTTLETTESATAELASYLRGRARGYRRFDIRGHIEPDGLQRDGAPLLPAGRSACRRMCG